MAKIIANRNEITREQWLELRRQGIGGSDAAAVMCMSRYAGPLKVWCDKKGLAGGVDESEYTVWGSRIEKVIRDNFPEDYEKKTGKQIAVSEDPFMYRSERRPWMLANTDGRCYEEELSYGGIEIKMATVRQADKWKKDELPDEHYCQAQHYMEVLDLPYFVVICLLGMRLVWRHVPRNDEFIGLLAEAERRFWEERVEADVMPEPTGLDSEDRLLRAVYPEAREEMAMLESGEFARAAQEYAGLKEEIEWREKRKKLLGQQLKAALGESKIGYAGNFKITWSRFERSYFELDRFKKAHPKLAGEYTSSTPSGSLRVTERKEKE